MAGVSCGAKDLSDILLKDKSGKIGESGKQVLLVEANTNITPTFLKYQNVNFLMALSQDDMRPDCIRMALIGALRFGKCFIIDIDKMPLYNAIETYMDMIKPGLYKDLLSGEVTKNEYWKQLVKPTDDEPYQGSNFNESQFDRFHFVVLTHTVPEKTISDQFYTITIE